MAVVLWGVLWVLLALFALAAAVLFIPLRLRLQAATDGPAPHLRLQAVLFAGRGPRIDLAGRGKAKTRTPAKTRRKSRKRKTGRHRPPARVMARLASGLPRLLGDLLAAVHLVELRASGAFGLGDPAETGALFGLLAPLAYAPPPGSRLQLEVTPVFDRPHLEGRISAAVDLVPAALLAAVLRFGWRGFSAWLRR